MFSDPRATNETYPSKISASPRYGQSKAAYQEVQDRHEDIKKIEHTLEELAQLFNDVDIL